jgi:hypothetical protein
MILVFFFTANPQTTTQQMNYTVMVLGGFMFLAISWYYCPVYGGVHWFTGPISNFTPAIRGENRDEDSMSDKSTTLCDLEGTINLLRATGSQLVVPHTMDIYCCGLGTTIHEASIKGMAPSNQLSILLSRHGACYPLSIQRPSS